MKRILILVSMAVGLSACSMPFEEPIHTKLMVPYASNNKDQYLESENGKKLVVNSPLTQSNLSGFYDLPPAPAHPKVSVKPPVVIDT